jgi:sRNA-binding regulator protein Hfq
MLGNKTQADIERENQINAGRNIASVEEPVLQRPQPRRVVNNNKPSATNSAYSAPNASKSAFQAKGHDAVLKAAQDRAATVTLTLTSGVEVTGLIIARDRYTISIKPKDSDTVIVYKHFIGMFKTVKGDE